jgi:hypothetical protein
LLPSRLSENIKITICETIILPTVVYGCETWSLTLKKEPRQRAFESRMMKRKTGRNRDEIEPWGKLYNEEFNYLYFSPNIIRMIKSRRMRWEWHVARMQGKRNAHRF